MNKNENRDLVFDEVNLMLAEKRTALSLLRTGIAIFSIPLSVGSILIATSKLYQADQILFLMIPVLAGCTMLVLIALWLIVDAFIKLRRNDQRLERLVEKNQFLEKIIDS